MMNLETVWAAEQKAIAALEDARIQTDIVIAQMLRDGESPSKIARIMDAKGRNRIYRLRDSGLPKPKALQPDGEPILRIVRDEVTPKFVHVTVQNYPLDPSQPDKFFTLQGTYDSENFETVAGDELGGVWQWLEQ